MKNARNEYRDIIDMPHHRSAHRKPMSLHDRAAQFAPFAALRGYEDVIEEEARVTQQKADLSEEEALALDEKTRVLLEHIAIHPLVKLTYFVPDARKEGGAYRVKEGKLRRIDTVARVFCFEDREEIAIDMIQDIEGELF